MASVLHLLTGPDAALARFVIDQNVRAGDKVSAVFLEGSAVFDLPEAVRVRRMAADLSYAELLELIFASDHVITW
jgi:hypothetical protein